MVSPALLESYDRIVPDGANRLFSLVEQQSGHRMSLERQVVAHNIRLEFLGWLSGTLIGLSGVIGGIILIAIGKDISGLAALIGSITALAAVFFYRQTVSKNEMAKKQQAAETH